MKRHLLPVIALAAMISLSGCVTAPAGCCEKMNCCNAKMTCCKDHKGCCCCNGNVIEGQGCAPRR